MVVGTAVGVRVKEEAKSIAIDGLPFTRLERNTVSSKLIS